MGSGTSKSFESSSSSFAPKGGSLADHVVLRGRTELSTTRLGVVLDQSVEGDDRIDDVATQVDGRISRSSRGSTHTPVSTWDASAASNVRRHRDAAATSHYPSLRLVIEPQASLTSCPSMSITDNTLSSCCDIAPPMCEAGEEDVRPLPAPGSRPTGLRLVIGQQSSLVSIDIRPYEEEMLRSTHVATTAAHSMNSLLLDEQEQQQQQQQQPHQSSHRMSSFHPVRLGGGGGEDSEFSFHRTSSLTIHSSGVGEEEERNRQQQHNSVWFMEEGGDGGGAFRHILSKQPTGNVSAVGEPQLFDEGTLLVDSHRCSIAESV